MSLLYAIGAVLLILGIVGFFTHVIGLGIGAIVVGAVMMVVAYFVGGTRTRRTMV